MVKRVTKLADEVDDLIEIFGFDEVMRAIADACQERNWKRACKLITRTADILETPVFDRGKYGTSAGLR